MMKKIAIFAGIVLVLFFVIAQPTTAAGLLTNVISFLRDAAGAIIQFVTSVFSI